MRKSDHERLEALRRYSMSCEAHEILEPIPPNAQMREDENPQWNKHKGYYRLFRKRAYEPRLCGSCGQCLYYIEITPNSGICSLSNVGVRVGDWCGQSEFMNGGPGIRLDDHNRVIWEWPSTSWEYSFDAKKKCRSCKSCSYAVALKRTALCRYDLPKQGLYGPEWPVLESPKNTCSNAIYARPVVWWFF